MRLIKYALFLVGINCLYWLTANAQSTKAIGVKDIVARIHDHNTSLPTEKLHLLTDKPNYFAGDTLWFKLFLVNGGNKRPSYLSNKVYVELLNDSSRVVDRLVIATQNGMGEGDFKLPSNICLPMASGELWGTNNED